MAAPSSHLSPAHAPVPRESRPPAPPPARDSLADAVVASAATRATIALLRAYADSAQPVQLVGDTGTGKTYFAQLLHARSGRSGPFHDVTAGELSDQLTGDVLFGHERGAFTDAKGRRTGLLAAAARGTLLIDDFQGLDPAVQHQLLRALDGRGFRRLGTDATVPLACRLVIGLNAHPDQLVAEGRLLPDLRYRLGHGIATLAPLAQRREEIPLFARRFLDAAPAATRAPGGPDRFARGVIELLTLADWPGNVRDLRESVYHAYLLARAERSDAIRADHLPPHVRPELRWCRHECRDARRRVVAAALAVTDGDVGTAAHRLGVHRNTVMRLRT